MTPKGFPERNVISHAGMGELKPDSQNKHPETIKKKKRENYLEITDHFLWKIFTCFLEYHDSQVAGKALILGWEFNQQPGRG